MHAAKTHASVVALDELLRPIVDATSQDKLRDLIVEAYKEHESALAEAV